MADQTELPTPGDWRPADSNLARAVAAILIANSHLEAFYPRSWMAGDGLMGNGLFFFLSGFGVALGTRSRSRGFWHWYRRRATRLYPAVLAAGLIVQVLLLHEWHQWSVPEAARIFIYPTTYGYVGHIMIVYAGLYWLLRPDRRWLAIATCLTASASVLFYLSVARKMPAGSPLSLGESGRLGWDMHWFYFTTLSLGGALFAPITSRPRKSAFTDAAALGALFAIYSTLKLAMVHGHLSRAFFLLHLLSAAMCVLFVRLSANDALQRALNRLRPLGWLVTLVAGLTLEMYIVQTWTHVWPALTALRFPLNLLAFWSATVAGAVVLKRLTRLGPRRV